MNTRAFLTTLASYPDRALVFEMDNQRIKPGYHVTEIKAVSTQSMDCGGQGDAWTETVIQLWTPGDSGEYMRVSKFLNIYRRVASQVPVAEEGEVRLEYGEVGAPAISYFVKDVRLKGEVVVRLEPPFVACKEVERSASGDVPDNMNELPVANAASGCCTPEPSASSSKQTSCCG